MANIYLNSYFEALALALTSDSMKITFIDSMNF